MGTAYIGTSGFSYSSWKSKFYPDDLPATEMLPYYASHFNSVEINSSFYGVPRASTVEKWLHIADKEFSFAIKAPQDITHKEDLKFDEDILKNLFASLEPLKMNVPSHVVLFQLPGSTPGKKDALLKLLSALPKGLLFAFEFRNKSWFKDEIFEVLREHHAAVVFSDSAPRSNGMPMWPKISIETSDFFYTRLHGASRLYESNYSEEELKLYAAAIKNKLAKDIDIYLYFNNTRAGHATENATRLMEMLKEEE